MVVGASVFPLVIVGIILSVLYADFNRFVICYLERMRINANS